MDYKNSHPVVVALCEGRWSDVSKHVNQEDLADAETLAEYMQEHGKKFGEQPGQHEILKIQGRLMVKYGSK